MNLGNRISFESSGITLGWEFNEKFTPIEPEEVYTNKTGLKSISGQITISISKKWESPTEIEIKTPFEAVISGRPRLVLDPPEEVELDFDLYYSQPPSLENKESRLIEMWVSTEEVMSKFEIGIPYLWPLNVAYQITNEDQSKSIENLCETYGADDIEEAMISVRRAGYQALPYYRFLLLMDRLVSHNAISGSFLSDFQGAKFFRDQLIGDTSPFSMTSWKELLWMVEEYSEYQRLENVDIDQIVRLVLLSLHKNKPSQEKFFNKYDCNQISASISEPTTANYAIAWECKRQKFDNIKVYIRNWPSKIPSIQDYDTQKYIAKDAGRSQASEQWLKLLPVAIDQSQQEFKYVLGKYLSWVTGSERVNETFILKQASAVLDQVGADTAAQHTKISAYEEKGFENLYRNDQKAVDAYQKSLDIANNESGKWPKKLHNRGIGIFVNKTIAEAHHKRREGNIRDGLNIIQERINFIDSVSDITEEEENEYKDKLEAEKHRLSAALSVSEGEFQTAKSLLGESIKKFQNTPMKGSAEYIINEKDKLQAFICERRSEFRAAANRYENLAVNIEENFNSSGEAYRARQSICKIKQEILNNNYETAYNEYNKIDTKRHFEIELEKLEKIIQMLIDFNNQSLTDTLNIHKSGRQTPNSGPMGINYQTEYNDVLTVVAGAQRLSQLLENTEWLDEVIQIAMENAFQPSISSFESISESSPTQSPTVLDEFNIENIRLQMLPRHVSEQVEKAELNKVTNAMDYTEAGGNLTKSLEFYLEILAEYYGKLTWGDSWKKNIGANGKKISLGHGTNLFSKETKKNFKRPSMIEKLLKKPIINGKNVVQIRNDYHGHGNEPNFSQENYNRLREHINKIYDNVLSATPVVINVVEIKQLGYCSAELFWNYSPKRIFINSTNEVNEEEYYYIPRSAINGSVAEIKGELIACEEDRIHNNLSDLSITR